MKYVASFFLVLFLLLFGLFYIPFNPIINIGDQDLKVLIYETPIERVRIKLLDSEIIEIKKWIENDDNSWTMSLVSYVPKIYIRGESFALNIHRNFVVLNYDVGWEGRRMQVVKEDNNNMLYKMILENHRSSLTKQIDVKE